MKNLFAILMLTMLSMAVTFTSCKKDEDDDKKSSGNNLTFSNGYLEDYGYWSDGIYNFDITLTTSGIDYESYYGSGNLIYFETFTNSETFEGGTFVFSPNETAGTFDYCDLVVNGNFQTQTADRYYVAVGGILTVTPNENNYNITYSIEAQEYSISSYVPIGEIKTLSGSFSGPLTMINSAKKDKKQFIKK